MKRTIKIHVAGQQYILRSDADENYVQSLAESVNARINALKGNRQVATQSDVVLAALKLADELQHEQLVQANLRTQARQHVQRMLDHLTVLTPQAEPQPAPADQAPPVAAAEPTGSRRGGSKSPGQPSHPGQKSRQSRTGR